MKRIFYQSVFIALGGVLVFPLATMAISGTGSGDVRVKIYAEQGNEWFRGFTTRADSHGVLEIKNMLPGWYKATVNEGDEADGQTVALKARMLDLDGRRIEDDTTFDLYQYDSSGNKVAIGTATTDDKGWLEVSGLSADTEYKFEIDERDDSSVGDEDGEVRIRCKAKIGESDWFSAYYNVTKNNILEVRNVLPGRYKFKYKTQDRDPSVPFILQARLLNNDAERIKEPTKVHLWAYLGPEKTLTFAGEVWTDARGVITVPGLMHDVKYKVEVFEK
jgi:hypothetical protein